MLRETCIKENDILMIRKGEGSATYGAKEEIIYGKLP